MNAQQISCFLTAAEELNFSRAAARLFLSQPAITYQISSLEKELDVRLFERRSNGVSLTPAGEAFLMPAKDFLSAYQSAMDSVSGFRDSSATLVLGCPRILTALDDIFPKLVTRLVNAFPQYRIQIREISGGELTCKELLDGADCLISFLPADSSAQDLECLPLFQTGCYLAVSRHHPCFGQSVILPEKLAGLTIYYGSDDEQLAREIRKGLSGSDYTFTALPALPSCYPALAKGLVAFLLPRPYKNVPADVFIPIQLQTPLPPTCVIYRRTSKNTAAAKLAAAVEQLYKEYFTYDTAPR